MSTNTILIVDDEPANRNTIIRLFDEYDFDFIEAGDGHSGIAVAKENEPDLILLDLLMPFKDGFQFLAEYTEEHKKRKIPICVMTGMNDAQTRTKAIHLGADDFIAKPFDPVELQTRITSLLRISNYQHALATLNGNLEKMVAQRTQKLQQALEQLEISRRQNTKAYREMIGRICTLSTLGHDTRPDRANRLALCAAAIAWLQGLSADTTENIALAAQLHDIGMLALPEKLRNNTLESLSEEELKQYFTHTQVGSRLFANSDIPLLQTAHSICAFHHEHFDGTGAPTGLTGTDIPLETRIFSIAEHIISALEQAPTANDSTAFVRGALLEGAGHKLDSDIVATLLESDDTLENLIDQCR